MSETDHPAMDQIAADLIDNIPVCAYVLDLKPDGSPNFLCLSKRWEDMVGIQREHVLKDPSLAFKCVHPDDYEDFMRLNQEVFAGKLRFCWEGRMIVRGEIRWFSIESNPRLLPQGQTVWEGVMIDITKRKRVEDDLSRTNQKMQIAAAAAGIGFWEHDMRTGLADWDEGMYQLYGVRPGDTHRPWETYLIPEDRERTLEKCLGDMERGNRGEYEFRILRPDGELRQIKAICVAKRDSAGRLQRLIGINFDITALKLAENRLRDNEAKLMGILSNVPIPIACNSLGPDPRITFVNEAFLQTFGYTREEIPDVKRWAELAYPDPEYRASTFRQWGGLIAKSHETHGHLDSMEVRITCKDGTRKDVLLSATVLPEMEVIVLLDITRDKKTREIQRIAQEWESRIQEHQRAELRSKLKTSLAAAAIAHEINQPLSTILMNIRMVMDGIDSGGMGTVSARPYVADIAAEAERVVTTIEKMRSLLRNVQTELAPTDLTSVVNSALLYLKSLISSHRIQLRKKGLHRSLVIPGDAAQLKIAVINLIRNAVEAIAQHGSDKRVIRVELSGDSGTIELLIGDSGPGLPFACIGDEPLTTTKPDGTGIGLFLVRTTMENHHARIHTGRSPLGGAEFSLLFSAWTV